MKWIVGFCALAVIFGIAVLQIPAQTITPDAATLKLFPPEATGVAALDVASLRNSSLFRDVAPKTNYPDGMKLFIEQTGFQPDRDIDFITAAKIGRQTVAVIRARYDKFKVEQFISDHKVSTDTYLGRVLYSPNANEAANQVSFSFIDDKIVAGSTPAVKQVIDRLAAPARSVIDNPDLMKGISAIEVGNQVWAVGQFDLQTLPQGATVPAPAMEFLKNFTGGSYQMRVDSGVHVRAIGNFNSPDAARQTADVARGLIAVAKFQSAQKPDMMHLLDGVQLDYSGNSITLRFEGDGELLKKFQAERRGSIAE